MSRTILKSIVFKTAFARRENCDRRRPGDTIQAGEASVRPSAAWLALLRLVDIPEHRRRRAVDHPGERLPPNARRHILPEWDVGHLFEDAGLDLGCDLLLLVGRARTRILIAQRF